MIIEQANAASPIEIRQDEPFTLSSTGRTKYHILMWVVLLLTCIGTSWFSYQYFLVPQPRDYAPDWHGAQWVQATDSTGSVAYFRYVIQLNSSPDTAFVTITANQTFLLYVNGSYIGSNTVDFVQGDAVRAYMYDVDSVLRAGPNVIAVRVMNVDQKKPTLRASLGLLWGQTVEFHGTGDRGWQATGQSALVYPRYTAKSANWVTPTFDSSTWQGAQSLTNVPGSPMLAVDPLTYEQPLPIHWIKAGASDDSYFIRQFSLSAGFTEVLLRLTATGTSDIFINGQQFAEWRGQVATAQDNVVSYLSDGTPVVQYRAGLAMGVYDVSPFLHAGTNTIAIHLSSPGLSASQVGLATSGSAMGIDMLARWGNNHATVLTTDPNWRVSSQPVAGWFQSSNPTLTWPSATLIGRPGNSRAFYLPDSNTPRNVVMLSPVLIAEVLVGSLLAVVGLWLLMSRVVVRRYYPSLIESCEAMSLAFLPALALEALLVTLAREQQIPNPFPYTWQWGLALIALVVISYIFLWVHARRTFFQRNEMIARQLAEPALLAAEAAMPISSTDEQSDLSFVQKVRQWLKNHWLLIPIILVAIPMISYNLNYEPYWQDELSSLNAAKGILAHGIPIYISGFLYPKGEGYSYLLALSMVIFGDQNGVTRLLTMLEYLISLPLFYGIGCYFFDRRISILATAMLAFSPYALLWGRQTRMYEQAFLVTLIVAYLLYYSLQHYQRARLAFLTVGCILFAYLSHEETFIILPAVVVCTLLFSPRGEDGVPLVLRQKHWWFAMIIGVAFIGTQLAIVRLSHPPTLGTDQSQRPEIQPTLDNIPYYLGLFFNSKVLREGIAPWIIVQPIWAVNSILAILGCIWAFRRPDYKARYCALLLIIPLLTLAFIFTMQADRYVYPLFSMYYLMGAYATLRILRAIWAFARPYLASDARTLASSAGAPFTIPSLSPDGMQLIGPAGASQRPIYATAPAIPNTARSVYPVPEIGRIVVIATVSLLCASVLIQPMLPLSNFNLFFSRVTGLSYHRHFPDYDEAGQYVKSHWQPGDIIVTAAPDLSTAYYFSGHAEYFFSIDRALYLFETKNGQIIDTALGSRPILSESDFQTLLASHSRIWLISDNGSYQASLVKGGRFIFPPPDFQLVYEGYGSAVYFRGNM